MPPPGVVALVAVGIGVGTLVAGVHEMQKNERKVIMEFFAVLLEPLLEFFRVSLKKKNANCDVQHFLNYFEPLAGTRVKHNCFWESWKCLPGPETMSMMGCWFSQSEIEKFLIQNEAE